MCHFPAPFAASPWTRLFEAFLHKQGLRPVGPRIDGVSFCAVEEFLRLHPQVPDPGHIFMHAAFLGRLRAA